MGDCPLFPSPRWIALSLSLTLVSSFVKSDSLLGENVLKSIRVKVEVGLTFLLFELCLATLC